MTRTGGEMAVMLPAVLLFLSGCNGPGGAPIQGVVAGVGGIGLGGRGKGVVTGLSAEVWPEADGLGAAVEVGLGEGADGAAGGAAGVSVWSGPDLFYLLFGGTGPEWMRYAAPWVGGGTGIWTENGKSGWYGEFRVGICVFLPERFRLRAGWVWGSGASHAYGTWRLGWEFLF